GAQRAERSSPAALLRGPCGADRGPRDRWSGLALELLLGTDARSGTPGARESGGAFAGHGDGPDVGRVRVERQAGRRGRVARLPRRSPGRESAVPPRRSPWPRRAPGGHGHPVPVRADPAPADGVRIRPAHPRSAVLRTAAVRWPDRPPRARVRPGGAGPHHRTEPRGRFRGLRLCSVPARPVPVAARPQLGSQPHAAEGQRMTLSSLVFATAVLACSPARDTVDRACACPEGTEHVKTKTSAERASNAYYPQAEEYCRRKSEHGTWVIHGHYILWGPNGERL